jgi:hypothetical protein
MKFVTSGYTSNGNAKCRLGCRSNMRLSPSVTPVVSSVIIYSYLERPVA